MSEINLCNAINDILNNEPYKSITDTKVKKNPLREIIEEIKFVTIDNEQFSPLNKYVPSSYAQRIINVFWSYYMSDETPYHPFPQTSKEINKDVKTIQKFLKLLKKNLIYNNDLESSYVNKKEDKNVYDYCNLLLNDLESKTFKKNLIYKRTQMKKNKNEINLFFKTLQKEFDGLTTNDIDQFINSI